MGYQVSIPKDPKEELGYFLVLKSCDASLQTADCRLCFTNIIISQYFTSAYYYYYWSTFFEEMFAHYIILSSYMYVLYY